MEEKIEKLRFPIGKFQSPQNFTDEIIKNWIKPLKNFLRK